MHRPLSSGPYAAHRYTFWAPVLNVCHFQHDNPGGRKPSRHCYCSRMVPHGQTGWILLGMQQRRRHSRNELHRAKLRGGTHGPCARLRKTQSETVHGYNVTVQRRSFGLRQIPAALIQRRRGGPCPGMADDALYGTAVFYLDIYRNNLGHPSWATR